MTLSRYAHLSNGVLRAPLLWGAAVVVAAYALRDRQLGAPLAPYLVRDPWGYLEVLLFGTAMASIVLRVVDAIAQFRWVDDALLAPNVPGGHPVEYCGDLIHQLEQAPAARQSAYRYCRLHDALASVARRGAAESLDEELRFLSARDRRRMWRGYGLVGLTLVLLPALACACGLPNAFAFDRSPAPLVALMLEMVLLASVYIALEVEHRLLTTVDRATADELAGRFQRFGTSNDPQVLAVRRMADAVVQVTDRLVNRQAELWQSTIQAAHQQWSRLSSAAQTQTEAALEAALDRALSRFADQLAASQSVRQSEPMAEMPLPLRAKSWAGAVDAVHGRVQPLETKPAENKAA